MLLKEVIPRLGHRVQLLSKHISNGGRKVTGARDKFCGTRAVDDYHLYK